MAVSSSIVANLQALQTAVTASAPLNTASRILIEALEEQGSSVLTQINTAMNPTGIVLDVADPVLFPGDMVAVLVSLATASEDQTTLADMRGLVGRAMFNLAQAGP